MAISSKKTALLEKLRKSGYDEEVMAWFSKRLTIRQLENLIKNDQTMDAITRTAVRNVT